VKCCRICGEKHHAKGLCEKHYKKEYRQLPLVKLNTKFYRIRYRQENAEQIKAWKKDYYARPEVKAHLAFMQRLAYWDDDDKRELIKEGARERGRARWNSLSEEEKVVARRKMREYYVKNRDKLKAYSREYYRNKIEDFDYYLDEEGGLNK